MSPTVTISINDLQISFILFSIHFCLKNNKQFVVFLPRRAFKSSRPSRIFNVLCWSVSKRAGMRCLHDQLAWSRTARPSKRRMRDRRRWERPSAAEGSLGRRSADVDEGGHSVSRTADRWASDVGRCRVADNEQVLAVAKQWRNCMYSAFLSPTRS